MESRIARLIVQEGQMPNMEYVLGKSVISIGRSSANDIVINDSDVSRNHARLIQNDKGFVIEDLESTNGTFVNDQAVTTLYTLRDGDLISLGDSISFLFLDSAGDNLQPTYTPPPSITEYDSVDTASSSVRPLPQPPEGFTKNKSTAKRHEHKERPTRWWLSCGCVILLLAIISGAVVFALDAVAPDLLYCGPLQPFFAFIVSFFDLVPNC